jgi:hypothetical protein
MPTQAPPVRLCGRVAKADLRTRKRLTPGEVDALMDAAKGKPRRHHDPAFRHGPRASEARSDMGAASAARWEARMSLRIDERRHQKLIISYIWPKDLRRVGARTRVLVPKVPARDDDGRWPRGGGLNPRPLCTTDRASPTQFFSNGRPRPPGAIESS